MRRIRLNASTHPFVDGKIYDAMKVKLYAFFTSTLRNRGVDGRVTYDVRLAVLSHYRHWAGP